MTDTAPRPSRPAARPPWVVQSISAVSAIVCASIAWSAFAAADTTAANLGFAFTDPAGRVEFVTFYGGFYLGVTVLFLWAVRDRTIAHGAMAFLLLGNAGAFVGRVITVLSTGTSTGLIIGLAVGEIVLAGLGAVGLYRLRQR